MHALHRVFIALKLKGLAYCMSCNSGRWLAEDIIFKTVGDGGAHALSFTWT